MTKAELLKLLEDVDDDTEVAFWNGYVDDYMSLSSLEVVSLVKENVDFIHSFLVLDFKRRNNIDVVSDEQNEKLLCEAKKLEKNRDWELPNPHLEPENYNIWYGTERKKLAVLFAELRDKTSFGRGADLKY